jgi:hypothetical protein
LWKALQDEKAYQARRRVEIGRGVLTMSTYTEELRRGHERLNETMLEASQAWGTFVQVWNRKLRHEGCERRGGVCDCGDRPCALELVDGLG